MATYPDPDAFFDQSQVDWGNGGGTESIRSNLKSTNGAVYRIEPAVKDVADAVKSLPAQVAAAVVDAIAAKRWPWENQDGVPDDQKGTNNLFEAVQAGNGQEYRNSAKLDALVQAVADLSAKVDKLASSGN